MIHPLLERQLKKVSLEAATLPNDLAAWTALLERMSLIYTQSEQDRYLLERSLSLASEEMQQEISERKQAEERLAEERNLLRTLIDSVPDDIFVVDGAGRYLLANVAHAHRAGFDTPERIIGKTDFDLFPLEIAQQSSADDQVILRSGKPSINQEESTIDESGQQVWVSTTRIPLRNRQGDLVSLVGVTRDITQLKRAQEALKKANEELELRIQARVAELEQTNTALQAAILERKQTEEALKNESNLLRTLIDSMPADVYIKDTECRFVDANIETVLKLGGKTPSDLIGKTDFDFFPEEVAAGYFADEQRLIESGQPLLMEKPMFDRRTGEDVWVLTTKAPIRNEQGKVTGLVGIGLEINERKRIEKALEEERTLLRTLIDAMPDYIYIKDLQSRFVMGNTATALSLGAATAEAIVGKTDFDFHPPEIAAQFYADEQALFRSGKALLNQEELVIDQRTGKWQNLLSMNIPLYDSQGQITGLVGVNRDITERKRAELSLLESEERYRTVTELMSDYAFSMRVEPDGTMVDEWVTTDSFMRFTGYTWEEIDRPNILYHPDEVSAVQEQMKAVLRGESGSQECRILTKSGELRWMHIYRRPVWDKTENRVVRYFGVAQDITERKQAEEVQHESERLRLALEKEKELGELKTRLMITISHEFRTPLSIAYTSAEMLERYYERMTVVQREIHLHKIGAEIKRLTGMLEDMSLLIYARFGQLTLNLESTDLKQLCEAAILKLEDFEEAKQRIAINIDEPLPELMVDTRRIQYVVTNLLSNSLKYSGHAMKVSLDLFRQGDGVMIQVTDHGIGITHEDQARLFEPFYRANNVGAVGGTGLGLSIVKEIVEMHRGTISLRSDVNQGTQVTVFLPGE